jgi:hypothetical protein
MSNPFFRLPIAITDASAPVVAASARPMFPPAPETAALGHWRFGGGVASLNDVLSGQALTPAGAAPSYAANALTLAGGGMHGLLTPYDDRPALTVGMICRFDSFPASDSVIYYGSATQSSGAGGGMGWLNRQSGGNYVPNSQRRTAANLVGNALALGNRFSLGEWYMIFFSGDDVTAKFIYVPVDGSGSELSTDTAAAVKVPATPMRKIGLGNVHYDNASFYQPLTVSEAVIWGSRLSPAECLAAARRLKASAAYRGLNVKMAA